MNAGETPEARTARSPSDDPSTTSELLAFNMDTLRARIDELEEHLRLAKLKLQGIEAIGRSLVSEHNLERILEEVMRRTTDLLDADRATLYLLNDSGTEMWSKVLQGDELKTIELRVGEGIAGWVAQHGKPVNVKDAYKDPRFNPAFDLASSYKTRSILCQPLRNTQQDVIGVIQVLNKKAGYFTLADEHLLSAISTQAAITIQNSKLYLDVIGKNIDLLETQLRLEERTAELELLFRIERAAATATSIDQALTGILGAALDEFPSELAAVILHDPARDQLRYEHLAGSGAHRVTDPAALVGGSVVARAVATGRPVVVDDGHPAPELTAELTHERPDWRIRTLVCLPMQHQEERLGCLQLVNRHDDPRGFDEYDVQVLGAIAGRMGLAVQLARAMDEEQQAERLATIGQLLSGVMHDVKTPLTIISGYARLMEREEDTDTRHEYRQLIQKQITQLKGMTQELLAFARGDSKLLLRKVLINPFLAEVTEILREDFSGSGVDLIVDAVYRGAVRMDESKMKRVVFNLARNAREAMPGGGTFRITVEEEAGQVVFRFADDGPGIADELAGSLFAPFVTHGKKNGTGLGLAIVKKIVEEHEGTVDVTTAPGQGTAFTIRLPAQ